ncbi:hypothetical protein Tco_1121175 [Tanacetum coccineum]|uniref:Uncharacterized protein n=1 Tax=Tanacetum coccineum TaxID=301880 RepID=A0ABQ5IYH1_9ASTR
MENLIDILSRNKVGKENKRLKGRDWTDFDAKSSKEMMRKIDETLKHREQLRRLEEYVRGRPKTINPCTFVRPMYFSFGRHLDELHVAWAHLEKKQTRLQTNTKSLEDLYLQSLETASQAIHDAVTTH